MMCVRRRLVPLGMALAAMVLVAPIVGADAQEVKQPGRAGPAPQCAHWCMSHACEVLGVPVQMKSLVEMLPTREGGHSLLEVADTLESIGLRTEGLRATFDELAEMRFPAIAHMQPNHFVMIERVENTMISLLDGQGRRTVRTAEDFQKQWSGKLLRVWREPGDSPLPSCPLDDGRTVPRIQFDTLFIDKGEVRGIGKEVSYVFPFRNRGAAPLLIEAVRPSCRCVVAEKPDMPIPPGEQAAVTLRYNLAGHGGPFEYAAMVKTNDPCVPLVRLVVAGNTAVTLSVVPSTIDLGTVPCGRRGTAFFTVTCRGDTPLVLTGASCSIKGIRSAYLPLEQDVICRLQPAVGPQPLVQRNTWVVQISYEPDCLVRGKVQGVFCLKTNVKGFEEISLPIRAQVITPIVACPGLICFGDVRAEEQVRQTITVVSLEKRGFTINSVHLGDERLQCVYPHGVIQEMAQLHFDTTGMTAAELSGSKVAIEFEMVPDGPITLELPIYAVLQPETTRSP